MHAPGTHGPELRFRTDERKNPSPACPAIPSTIARGAATYSGFAG